MNPTGDGRTVLVVGAGFSGLSAAYFLQRAGFDVEIREAAPRVGGMIGTLETPYGPVETAANGLLNSGLVEEVFSDLGVEMRTVARTANARFIFRDGRPRRWPLTLLESLRLLPVVVRAGVAKQSLAPRAFESIREWGARVLSPSVSRYSIETALQGIYAGDPARMSATLILGHLFSNAKQASLSERRPHFRGTVSVAGGMERLIERFRESLSNRGARIELQRAVGAQELKDSRRPVVIATGIERARTLLELLDPERATLMRSVETLPLVSIGAHFPKASSRWRGFGCLFPPGEAKALGVLWNDDIWNDGGEDATPRTASETWILGGALFHSVTGRSCVDLTDQELLNIVIEERSRVTGLRTHPVHFRVTRWPSALPHFTVEMEDAALRFRPNRGNLYCLGNYTGGIGLAKILEQAARLQMEIDTTGVWK